MAKEDWQYCEEFDAATAALGLRAALQRLAALFEVAHEDTIANALFDLLLQIPPDAQAPGREEEGGRA